MLQCFPCFRFRNLCCPSQNRKGVWQERDVRRLFLSGRVFQSIKTLFLCFASTEHQSRALPDTQLSYVTKVQFPGGTFHTLTSQQMWHYCELHVTYHWLPVKATVSQAAGEPHGHATLQYRGNYWIKTVHGNKLAK